MSDNVAAPSETPTCMEHDVPSPVKVIQDNEKRRFGFKKDEKSN